MTPAADANLRKIFENKFSPLFEVQPELGLSDLLRCFPGASVTTLCDFMANFMRLNLVQSHYRSPYLWTRITIH